MVSHSSQHQERTAMEFRARLQSFAMWLKDNGALLSGPTNKYEVLRYSAYNANRPKGRKEKPAHHVVYKKGGDGRITFTGSSFLHFSIYMMGGSLPDQTPSPSHLQSLNDRGLTTTTKERISWTRRMRNLLLARDGGDCWLCGKTMLGCLPNGDDDITIEHMRARSLCIAEGLPPKFYNHQDNLVLEHAKCNRDMGHRPVSEKEIIRDYVRRGLITGIEGWRPDRPVVPSPRPRKRIKP